MARPKQTWILERLIEAEDKRRAVAEDLIGKRVHSFDFPGSTRDLEGERACYVTGTVPGILKAGDLASDGETSFADCDRYIIVADSRIFAGKPEALACEGQEFFPPLNGTMTSMGNIWNCVDAVEGEVKH